MLRSFLTEMEHEQRRQFVDAVQTYDAWRATVADREQLGSLQARTSKGATYFTLSHGRVRKSLGRASPELLARKFAHDARRKALTERVQATSRRLAVTAPVNRALQLGRLRGIVARIVRELDREGLLGDHVIIAGTHALHAYEAACGVFIGAEHVATTDADLIWDGKSDLSLAAKGMKREGILGLLRRVDSSFATDYGYNAINKEGFIVDLICPETDEILSNQAGDGLSSTPIAGIEWLLSAPRFEQVVIGDDGLPVRLVVPEPRTFALHKLWVSHQDSRQILKRPRDRMHAAIVAELAVRYMNRSFALRELKWLPPELRKLIGELSQLRTQTGAT